MYLHMNIARSINIPYSDIYVHNNDRAKSESCHSSLIWWGIHLFYITNNNKKTRHLFLLIMTLENSLK